MSINWIRRFGSARLVALAIVSLFLGSAALEPAEARFGRSRGGGFSSFGNRGSRSSGFGTPSARMQPLPSQARPRNGALPNNAANRGSWFQRNPLMSGLIGAIAGTVIGSMLMNALGGASGLGSFLLLIMGALALFAIFRFLKSRKQPTLAGVGAGNGAGRTTYNAPNTGRQGNAPYSTSYSGTGGRFDAPAADAPVGSTTGNTQTREQGLAAIALEDATMTNERLQDTLSGRFFQVQEAWSSADRAALMAATTKSMFDEFIGDIDAMEKRGERNVLKNIVIRGFDITEAWQEGEWEFVTAHIKARLLDYTERGGQITSGDATNPTNFSEFWTFVRPRGKGEWRLSAVNQEA